MNEVKKFSLVKPNLQTPFHIDFKWWQENDQNWRVELRGLLCPLHQEALVDIPEDQLIDWIDPETAEVQQMDMLQHALISHCARQDGFLENTTLVDAVFRLLLANTNTPMSASKIGAHLNRQPETVLRTLTGLRVYKGLRPFAV